MTDRLLNDDVAGQVREVLERLQGPVEVLFFGKESDCDYCDDTQQLIEEVTDLSNKLALSVFDLEKDLEQAKQYNVDKAPGIVLAAKRGNQILDYGVRYAGIPSGHEFSSFIHTLLLVSGGDSQLSQKTRDFLAGLETPVHLQVFVTPT